MSAPLPWDSYEELTLELVDRLARANGVQTTRLERDVRMQGHATANQIDILWEFLDADAAPGRVVFECRSYGSPINQQALHSWRSVVDDISVDDVPTVGAMVTATGYQHGARQIADTYGMVILELRSPTEADTENRLWAIDIEIHHRVPRIIDFEIDPVQMISEQSEFRVLGEDLTVEDGSGDRVTAVELLASGELSTIDQPPTPFRRVARSFDPPRLLLAGEEPIAHVRAIAATVGEVDGPPIQLRVGGLETVAWMLLNTLSGVRVWFVDDGRLWTTEA